MAEGLHWINRAGRKKQSSSNSINEENYLCFFLNHKTKISHVLRIKVLCSIF